MDDSITDTNIDNINEIINSITNSDDENMESLVLSMFDRASKSYYLYNFVLLEISYISYDQFKININKYPIIYQYPTYILLIVLLCIWFDRVELMQYVISILLRKYDPSYTYIYNNIDFLLKIAKYKESQQSIKFLNKWNMVNNYI